MSLLLLKKQEKYLFSSLPSSDARLWVRERKGTYLVASLSGAPVTLLITQFSPCLLDDGVAVQLSKHPHTICVLLYLIFALSFLPLALPWGLGDNPPKRNAPLGLQAPAQVPQQPRSLNCSWSGTFSRTRTRTVMTRTGWKSSPFQGHFLSHTQISSFSYQKIGEKQKHPYLEPPLHFILSVMMGRNKIWMGPTYQDPRGSLKGQKGSYKRTCLSPRAKGYSQTVLKSLFKSYVAWISCILRSNKANCYKPLLRIFFPHNLRVNVIKDSLINESRLTGVSLLHETISCYEILVHVPELSGLVVTE